MSKRQNDKNPFGWKPIDDVVHFKGMGGGGFSIFVGSFLVYSRKRPL